MAKNAKSIAAALTKAAQKAAAAAAKNVKKTAAATARSVSASNSGTSSQTAKSAKTTKSTARTTAKKAAAELKRSRQTTSTLPDLFPAAKNRTTAEIPKLSRFRTTGQGTSKASGNVFLKGLAAADLGTKLGNAYENPVTAQYLPLSSDFRISSNFGVDRVTHRHSGIDLAVAEGTKVAAVKTGTVSFAGWGNGYGYRVVIDHPDGTQTTYNHLSDIGVKVGDSVIAGNPIALSGNTGNSTGPHLHFEVKKDGRYVDPELYFDFGNGLRSQSDAAYTSQMAAVSSSSSSGSATSAGSAKSSSSKSSSSSGSSSSGSSSKKKSTAALPQMQFPTVSADTPAAVTLPTRPKAQAPTITAYRAAKRSVPDYFQSPLTLLVPSYRHSSLRK